MTRMYLDVESVQAKHTDNGATPMKIALGSLLPMYLPTYLEVEMAKGRIRAAF